MEVIQVVLYMGAHEVSQRIGGPRADCIVLHSAYVQLHPINLFRIDNFCNNALMINMSERVATAWEEKNLLHDLQENEEEDVPPTNAISSDDS